MTGPVLQAEVSPPDSGPPDGPEAAVLVVDQVSVGFGGLLALDEVSMTVGEREVVGVIGPNGAGKTTLFNVMCGFVHPDRGTLTYRGRQLRRHHPHDLAKLGIARTLQGVGLCAGLTVRENVMLGAQPRLHSDLASSFLGLWRSSREERRVGQQAMELLDELGASEFAGRYPGSLPYAIGKRTALARALMSEPRLLLLDEPASGLSESEMDALGERIRGLTDRMSVLLVEHHMDLVMSVCDRIVVLNFGVVIAEGPPAAIRADPEVATAYLGDEVRDKVRDPEPVERLEDVEGLEGLEGVEGFEGSGARTVLEVRDLSVSYGAVQALRSVSFDAAPGSVTAVLGANGAGKTTLLRTISGLVKPQGGGVRFDGAALLGRNVETIARLGVSHVPEGRGVIEELTVEENLRLATLWCLRRGERQAAIAETLELFPRLRGFRKRHASTLSGGERQMLVLGRALISRPRLLLLDEPSLGLAPMVTAQLMALLREQTEGKDITVVLVEQNARSALSVSKHAVILNLGQVVVSDAAVNVAADDALRHHYLGF